MFEWQTTGDGWGAIIHLNKACMFEWHTIKCKWDHDLLSPSCNSFSSRNGRYLKSQANRSLQFIINFFYSSYENPGIVGVAGIWSMLPRVPWWELLGRFIPGFCGLCWQIRAGYYMDQRKHGAFCGLLVCGLYGLWDLYFKVWSL